MLAHIFCHAPEYGVELTSENEHVRVHAPIRLCPCWVPWSFFFSGVVLFLHVLTRRVPPRPQNFLLFVLFSITTISRFFERVLSFLTHVCERRVGACALVYLAECTRACAHERACACLPTGGVFVRAAEQQISTKAEDGHQ